MTFSGKCGFSIIQFRISIIRFSVYQLFFCLGLSLQAQVDPGVDFDLNGYINDRLDAGETTVVVPPGRYRVPEVDNYHLYFYERNDVTIIADNVELICTETVPAIRISRCNNFKIQGLTIDYDPLPFTQGVIVDHSEDKRTLTVDLIDGYSSTISGDKAEIFDPETGELVTTTYYGVSYTVDEETRRVMVTKPSNYSLNISNEEVGDIIVLGSRSNKAIPHSILPAWCTGLVLENVTLYSGATFGFFEMYCSGSQYINCKVDRRPLETEVRERGMRRMRSINADGFHSKHAEKGPSYIQCIARYNGDDGIAINGDYHVIAATKDSVLSVVSKSRSGINLAIGDSVELVSYTGVRFPNARVVNIESGRGLTDEERQFLQAQDFIGDGSDIQTRSNVYYVTLDKSIYLPIGSVIASANHLGNGFEVRDCIMGPNRSRGILVKSSDGIITGNTLTDNWGQAIKLAPEYEWLEAGSGNNIVVSDNVISGCHDVSIAVYSQAGKGGFAPIGAHDNIQIVNNSISGSTNPAIAVTSTSNLMLENNSISSPNNDLLPPWIAGAFGRNTDPDRQIYLNNFEVIYVTELTILNCPDEELTVGDTYDLNRAVGPANATDLGAYWTSEDESIASVDSRGIVTALTPGSVVITLSSNDGNLSISCTINIVEEVVELEVLQIAKDNGTNWRIYPNPIQDIVNISEGERAQRIILMQLDGQKIMDTNGRNELLLGDVPNGIYLLKIIGSDGRTNQRKVIVKK